MKKFRLGMIMAVFAFIAMLPLQVSAVEETEKTEEVSVTCTPNEGKTKYEVSLHIPNASNEQIATVSLKLDVTPDPTNSSTGYSSMIEFSKDVTEKAKVYEYRAGNTLNIYIAGTKALFEKDTLFVGTVSMKNSAGDALGLDGENGVKLSNAEDSILIVRGFGRAESPNRDTSWASDTSGDVSGDISGDIPPKPDEEFESEFKMPDSKEITVSEASADEIERSVLAYIRKNYADKLNELGEYKIVSRLDFSKLKEADVQQTVKDAFSAVLNGKKIGQYYDISIWADVMKDGTVVEGMGNIPIPQLEEKITLSLVIPESLIKTKRNYEMLHCRDDMVAESLYSRVNDNTISFSTDSFSPYALAYEDVKGTEDVKKDSSANPGRSAKTGDSSDMMLYFILGMMSFAGSVMVFAVKKKKAYR